ARPLDLRHLPSGAGGARGVQALARSQSPVSAALSPTVTRDDGAIAERRIVRIDWRKFRGVRRGHRLDHGEPAQPGTPRWITEPPDPRHVRRNLLEQFQPFSGEAVFKLSKSQ